MKGCMRSRNMNQQMDKIMRMHAVTSTIENGFVHLPDKAAWLGEYLHELTTFPKGKYDDQADSTSQALDWLKSCSMNETLGWIDYLKHLRNKHLPASGLRPSRSPCPVQTARV